MVKEQPVARYVDWCDRSRYRIIVAWVLLLAGGVLLARNLELRTSFAELLPNDDPGVVALNKTQERMGDMSLLLVGIRSPDHQANLRYAQTLTDQLNHLPKGVCELAAYHVRDLRDFFERNKWLYLGEQDLEDIRDTMRREISRRKNPLFVDLGDEEGTADLRKRIASRDKLGGRFRDGYFSRAGDQTVWIAALPPGGLFVENAGEALLQGDGAPHPRNPPESFHPAMRAHIGGPVTTAIENRRAVERDILWVTIICVGSGGAVHRHLLPPAARRAAGHGLGDGRRRAGLRRGRAGLRLPQFVDRVPGLDHRRQRHQLRHHADGPLRGGASGSTRPPARRSSRSRRRRLARHAGGERRGLGLATPRWWSPASAASTSSA